MYGLGYNLIGQLGLSNHLNHNTPQKISFFDNQELLQIALGFAHSFVTPKNGNAIYAFGSNDYGQLGLSHNVTTSTPQKVSFFDNHEIVQITLGGYHSLVWTRNGLFAFGDNQYGQLGLSHNISQNSPQKISLFDNQEILSIAVGYRHSFVLTKHALYGFGNNEYGQLGLPTNIDRNTPQKIHFFDDHEVLQISLGYNHSLVLTKSGLYAFGLNKFGQLGLSNYKNQNAPQKIDFFDNQEILQISLGDNHTFVQTETELFSFGNNEFGQLGLSHYTSHSLPQKIFFFDNLEILQISLGYNHSLVLTKSGLYAFGYNRYGQLGLSNNVSHNSPQKIAFFNEQYVILPNQTRSQIAMFFYEKDFKHVFLNIFSNSCYCDYVLQLKDMEFLAHKCVLHARCPQLLDFSLSSLRISSKNFRLFLYFVYTNSFENIQEKIFNNRMDDNHRNSQETNKTIPEDEGKSNEFVVKNHTNICQRDLIELFVLSEKIKFSLLKGTCLELFIQNLSPSNASFCLVDTLEYDCTQLRNECYYYLSQNKPKFTSTLLEKLSKYPADLLLAANQFSIDPNQTVQIEKDRNEVTQSFFKDSSLKDLMQQIYQRKELDGDYSIIVGGKPVMVHKCIVASQWNFFSSILLKEKKHNVEGIDNTLFEKIIKYYYLGSGDDLKLSIAEIYNLLSVCDYYGLDKNLIDYCCYKLNRNLSKGDWKEILLTGLKLDDSNLKEAAFEKIETSKPQEIVKFFLDLNSKENEKLRLLQEENLIIRNEIKSLKSELRNLYKYVPIEQRNQNQNQDHEDDQNQTIESNKSIERIEKNEVPETQKENLHLRSENESIRKEMKRLSELAERRLEDFKVQVMRQLEDIKK